MADNQVRIVISPAVKAMLEARAYRQDSILEQLWHRLPSGFWETTLPEWQHADMQDATLPGESIDDMLSRLLIRSTRGLN